MNKLFYYEYNIKLNNKIDKFNISFKNKLIDINLNNKNISDDDYKLIISLIDVISSINIFYDLPLKSYSTLKIEDNPFNKYIHKISKIDKLSIKSDICIIYPLYNIFNLKNIKVLEITNDIKFSNSHMLKMYRDNNVIDNINDIYTIIELNLNRIKINNNPYLIYPFEYIETDYNYKINNIYDIVFFSCTYFQYEIREYVEIFNLNLFINSPLFKNLHNILKKNGFLILSLRKTNTYLFHDILNLLSTLFKNVKIVKSILQSQITYYKHLICEYYNGNKIEKINEEFTRDLPEIYRRFTQDSYDTYRIITDVKEIYDDKLFLICRLFNNDNDLINKILKKLLLTENIMINNYYSEFLIVIENYKNGKNIDFAIENLMNNIYIKNIFLYFHLKIKINPMLTNIKDNEELLYIIPNIVNININNIEIINKNDNLFIIKQKLISNKSLLDTININKYSNFTNKIKISYGLKYRVSNIIKYKVSQAFLKMLEILNNFKIINKNKIKCFHVCEAPGQFILSFKYYCKKNEIDYEFYANSLNPYNNKVIEKYGNVFSDDYNLIKENKDRWLFGEDNTGDISNIENIISYSKDDYDIITADCGLPSKFNFDEEKMCFINYCQMLVILFSLKKNGNAIFKLFLPLTIPITIYILNNFYNLFDNINYFKPSLNPSSSEIYIICLNYKGISKNIKNELILNHKNYDKNKYNIKLIKKNDFFYKHINAIDILIDNTINSINRSLILYYQYNMYDFIEDKKIKLNKTKNEYINNWLNKYIYN